MTRTTTGGRNRGCSRLGPVGGKLISLWILDRGIDGGFRLPPALAGAEREPVVRSAGVCHTLHPRGTRRARKIGRRDAMNRTLSLLRLRALLLTTLMILGVANAHHAQNDAGSGGDAGDTHATALALSAYGSYTGELHASHDTLDWYTMADPQSGPACVELAESSDKPRGITLIVRDEGVERSAAAVHGDNGASKLAFAASDIDQSWFSVDPAPTSGTSARSGPYSFTLTAYRGVTTADAGTGLDAGAERAKAIALASGCHGGRLGYGQIALDTVDYYRIDMNAGDRLLATLGANASAPLGMLLEDANGNALTTTVGPDGLLSYQSASAAPVYLRMSSMSLSTAEFPYLVGLVVGPPGERPCSPYC